MAAWHSGDVDANGICLLYPRTGGDRPPLVRAPGVTDDGLRRAELIAEQHTAVPSWSDAGLEPRADSKLRVSAPVLNLVDPATPRTLDWPIVMRRITCPALLIMANTAHGARLTEDDTGTLRVLVAQRQIVHIPGTGHNIGRERL